MYDDNQINIPPSFMALFVDPGRSKLNASHDETAARYELCEDLASMLSETANNMMFSLGISEQDVIERCRLGLVGEQVVVTKPEADWVIRRLIELMSWS